MRWTGRIWAVVAAVVAVSFGSAEAASADTWCVGQVPGCQGTPTNDLSAALASPTATTIEIGPGDWQGSFIGGPNPVTILGSGSGTRLLSPLTLPAGGSLSKLTIDAAGTPLAALGPVQVDNSLLIARGSGGQGLSASSTLDATNVTIVNGGGSDVGVSDGHVGTGLSLTDSIVHGFATPFDVQGPNLTLDQVASDGIAPPDTANVVAAGPAAPPDFVDPAGGDYRLRAPWPGIDRADAAAIPSGATDLAGAPRVVDTDGQPGNDLDLGALEYQHQRPTASGSASPDIVATGDPVTFSGSGSDPDADSLAYNWAFDDGSSAGGSSVQHAFAQAGTHTATLTVTDPTGLTATSAMSVHVAAPVQAPADVKPPVGPTYRSGTCLNLFVGTARNDNLHGGQFGDVLEGLNGNDLLLGLGGDDCVLGNRGNDELYGNGGNDDVRGGAGSDTLYGGAGNDQLAGDSGNDKIFGGAGNDNIVGGLGRDVIAAGTGNDTVDVVDGMPDRVDCGPGKDSVKADQFDKLRHCEKRKIVRKKKRG